MAYRIGIDAGSKTLKLVVLDQDGSVVHHIYWRHRSDIRRTLTRMLADYVERYGNVAGSVAVTGSAGIAVAQMLGVPFVQEVIATTRAVQERYPGADAIVELGGEDAKVIYLTGNLEQRMNATCAGGTGGFIDTIAFMLGVPPSEMNPLAARATHTYPIASRCAVFAQTDVRPLLNAGASKEDIAASALEAVVRQTLGGLACGRPLRGSIVFLGGPFAFIPELSRRFAKALDLGNDQAIRPHDAHLLTAMGAALLGGRAAGEGGANVFSLSQLQSMTAASSMPGDSLERLPPLFANDGERRDFLARHSSQKMPRAPLASQDGPLYLGFDAGSTTVKYALVNEDGALVASGYRPVKGDVPGTAAELLDEMYRLLPTDGRRRPYIAQSVVIGYGDALLKSAFAMDADIVETSAHLRAARAFRPDVSFVLDIGGQDMKALWVQDGQLADAVLNEACSSGCGAFVEGTAYALGRGPEVFAAEALTAKSPLDLGTKCTVFMTSRVRHAQKAGAQRADIAAGIAYSVVQNALYRVIGRARVASMGSCAVVQGGTFMSDAVLRAFELVSGIQAVRPDTAHLMGAIGAALVARDRAHELRESAEGSGSKGEGGIVRSSLIGPDELAAMEARYGSWRCTGCMNSCVVSLVDFGDGRHFASGNRCSAGGVLAVRALEEGRVALGFGNGLADVSSKGNAGSAGLSEGRRTEAGSPQAGSGSPDAAHDMAAVHYAPPRHLVAALGEGAYPSNEGGDPFAMHRKNIAQDLSWAANGKSALHREWARLAQAKARQAPARAAQGEGDAGADAAGVRDAEAPCCPRIPYLPTGLALEEPGAAGPPPPNVVAFQQELLGRYAAAPPAKAEGPVIGIPLVLNNYEALPFWHRFFRELGFGVALADDAMREAVRTRAAESVPSESVCEPAKLSHGEVFALARAGAGLV